MNYDYIIVLTAASKDSDGKFPNFLGNMYLGGQVRVNAAAKLLDKYPKTPFIIVGGYNENNIGIPGTSKKVDDIVEFLKGIKPNANIQEIYSLPCTYHNFVAVFNYWKHNKISPKKVGVLSNAYHLPRALAFADRCVASILQAPGITFEPIAAEDIAPDSVPKFEDEASHTAYTNRLKYEESGLKLFRSGDYNEFCLTKDFDLLKDLIYTYPNQLLTEEEKQKLNIS